MSRRPPPPDLHPGDRVLIAAHIWRDTGVGRMWLPTGGYRWRVVNRVVFDTWCGWQVMSQPTAPHHPSRESASEVVSIVRPGGEHRPPPAVVVKPQPVQLDLFALT